eukprot:1145423-Pelagomonas_calceolata.AAC.5
MHAIQEVLNACAQVEPIGNSPPPEKGLPSEVPGQCKVHFDSNRHGHSACMSFTIIDAEQFCGRLG